MTHSDSMFLFEITVEELKSFIDCKEFLIRSQFADIFTLNLEDPNKLKMWFPKKRTASKLKKRMKAHYAKKFPEKGDKEVLTGQSVIITSSVDKLISNMKMYPLELIFLDKHNKTRLGSNLIPWNTLFIDYLNRIDTKIEPFAFTDIHDIFDEYSSQRMAAIKLNTKLIYFNDQFTTHVMEFTGSNSKHSNTLSTTKETQLNRLEETGIIKTIYNHGTRKFKESNIRNSKDIEENCTIIKIAEDDNVEKATLSARESNQLNRKLSGFVKSQTDIDKTKQISVVRSKSCSSIKQEQINILDYIFGDHEGSFGNQVYCVSYFTVENDMVKGSNSSKSSIKAGSSDKSEDSKVKYQIIDCPSKKTDDSCLHSGGSFDLLASNLINTRECQNINCNQKEHGKEREVPDERILLDLTNAKKDVTGKVEDVVGGLKAKIKIGDQDPCYCECECKFGFIKRTTYCNICGGYENTGEDMSNKQSPDAPFPCPIFHKLEKKIKAHSTSGSESKKAKRSAAAMNAELEKDKKGKKKKKDDRFKFNYGYAAPQIGHSRCAFPCTGTMGSVPKNMGWLWTADNIPGLKFRPMWKPGATNKYVVRLLRIAKNPNEIISKKKKKDFTKKKPLKRPLLIVHKKDGEYTVTMETVKTYSKPRAINQQPYEDKPLVTYTIGRTEEENLERQRKKERARRRLEREQREFIQRAFRDMCQEICLKTYQQALGILPDAESPDCPCYPADPGPDKTDLDHSCSCSEDKDMSSSDTDDDEWVVEFTPPSATFDPTVKTKKIVNAENSTQYTYLDYRVKIVDRFGNPVPRFFKGPDGKQQCSDLGGFWSPDHKWLEINVDGYIAPDGRWAPNLFIGPTGEQVDCETGKFQANNGNWLVVGIDGFVDSQGKWRYYPKPRNLQRKPLASQPKKVGDKKGEKPAYRPVSEASWSCFGFASPRQLSKMGIVGHGQDKKLLLSTLKDMLAHGEDVKLPVPSSVPRRPQTKKGKGKGEIVNNNAPSSRTFYEERTKCRHPVPSEKGIIAMDARGNKTYFRLKEYKNRRPEERMADLSGKGISLSSFHVPCFHSFISTETMKKQLYDRLRAKYATSEMKKTISTQA